MYSNGFSCVISGGENLKILEEGQGSQQDLIKEFVCFRKLTDHLPQQRQMVGFEGGSFGMEKWLSRTCNYRRAITLVAILEEHDQSYLIPWLVVLSTDQFQTNQEGKGD